MANSTAQTANQSDGDQLPLLVQDQITLDGLIARAPEEQQHTSGSPPTSNSRSTIDEPPLAEQQAPKSTYHVATATGDARIIQPHLGLGEDQLDTHQTCNLRQKRSVKVPNPPKPRPANTGLDPGISNISKKRKGAAAASPVAKKRTKASVDLLRLVEGVTSNEAILRFLRLIVRWREYDIPVRQRCKLPEGAGSKVTALWDLNRSIKDKGVVSELYRIVTEVKFVQEVDRMTGKAADNRPKAPEGALAAILPRLGFSSGKQFHNRMTRLRKAHNICAKPYVGIQCFLPFGEEEPLLSDYLQLSQYDIDVFRILLDKQDHIQELCKIGSQFLQCLWDGVDFPEQLWESRTKEELRTLDTKGLLRLMEPFQAIEENLYTTLHWRTRRGAPSIRPDYISDDCELCSEASCRCIATLDTSEFTVRQCGLKGRGLLAGVPGRGTLVFKKGDRLGRLVGELVPPKTYSDGWGLDLYNGGVQIAQIYPRNRGNLFRLVNHDCGNSFSAKVVCEIISGLLVPVFYAVRDIWDGDEITVKWSQDYRQGKECFCHSCHRHFDDRYGLN